MRRKPAKRWIKGGLHELQRFLGRVTEIKEGNYCLNLWPQWKAPQYKELHVVLSKRTAGLTVVGDIQRGSPIEMWTWSEKRSNGRVCHRAHIKRLY